MKTKTDKDIYDVAENIMCKNACSDTLIATAKCVSKCFNLMKMETSLHEGVYMS